jgi:hypothetical protein
MLRQPTVENFHLPIKGELEARMGSNCEKYISIKQITTMATPFSNSFSPACGGNQKIANVRKTITIAGVTTIALKIGDLRWMTKSNARRSSQRNVDSIRIKSLQ